MVEKLMTNTIRDDDQSLLPGIYPPEREHYLSSIFVDAVTPLVSLKHFQSVLSNLFSTP